MVCFQSTWFKGSILFVYSENTLVSKCCLFCFLLRERISLRSLGWPETFSVDQANLELTATLLSAGIKVMKSITLALLLLSVLCAHFYCLPCHSSNIENKDGGDVRKTVL